MKGFILATYLLTRRRKAPSTPRRLISLSAAKGRGRAELTEETNAIASEGSASCVAWSAGATGGNEPTIIIGVVHPRATPILQHRVS